MTSPDSTALIPSLRQATPEQAAALLAGLTLEELKPIAKEVAGMKRINAEATPESLSATILKVLAAGAGAPARPPQIGETVTDEESGEAVLIDQAFVANVHAINFRLEAAQHMVQRGLVETCGAIRDFQESRAYLYLGYSSFRAFCEAGQLRVFDQTRSYAWAKQILALMATLGEELVGALQGLPRRRLIRLAGVLSADGMEATLEHLKDKHQLSYVGDDGAAVVLALPSTAAGVTDWKQAIDRLIRRGNDARRAEGQAIRDHEDDNRRAAEERKEFLHKIDELEEQLKTAEGRSDGIVEQLAAAKKLTPEEIAKLQKSASEQLAKIRTLKSEIAAEEQRREELAKAVDKHHQAAAEVGKVRNVDVALGRMGEQVSLAALELEPLLAHLDGLPKRAREAAFGACNDIGAKFMALASRFEGTDDE